MKPKSLVLFILLLGLIYGCREEKMDYFNLGKESYVKGNYALAKSQFSSIESDNINYVVAKDYIFKIDSIENAKSIIRINKWAKKDSLDKIARKELFKKHKGTYRVRISKPSSSEFGDIYILNEYGVAIWEWASFYDSNKWTSKESRKGSWLVTDSTITINIMGNSEMISEVFTLRNGYFKTQSTDGIRWLQKIVKE